MRQVSEGHLRWASLSLSLSVSLSCLHACLLGKDSTFPNGENKNIIDEKLMNEKCQHLCKVGLLLHARRAV